MASVSFARAFFDEIDRSAAGFISQKGAYARLRPAGLFGSAIARLRIRGGVVADRYSSDLFPRGKGIVPHLR
jgi:hypothetical protein